MKRLFLFFLLFSSLALFAQPIILEGIFKQGGFFKSELPEEIKKCKFNNDSLYIYENFIFCGLKKDQPLQNKIVFYPGNGDSLSFDLPISKTNYKIQKINNIPKKYVEKPKNKKLEKRINKEYETLLKVRKNVIYKNKRKFFKEFNLPLIYRISGVFGSQRVVNGKPSSYHKGVDFAAPKGADVYSTADGIVVLTGNYFYNGKFVLIDHGLGVSSIYIHLSKISVMCGQFVGKGEKVGEVGDSGRAVGNHLHWGVYWFKEPINPLFLAKGVLEKRILE